MPRVTPGGDRPERDVLHPGPYLLALVWFQRKTGKTSGNPYLSCKFEVVGGRSKGRQFFSVMGLDLSKPGTVTRWQIYADACEVTEPFEIGEGDPDSDAEGDEDIQRLFVGTVFGTEVTQETSGQYTNNGIGKYIFPKDWKAPWRGWADEWKAARAAKSQRRPEEDLDDPDPAGGDEYSEPDEDLPPPARPEFAPIDDEDIPF